MRVLTLQPYDWNLEIISNQNQILCWALSKGNNGIEDSSKVLIRINNVYSVSYLKLPRIVDGIPKKWGSVTDINYLNNYFLNNFKSNAPELEIIRGRTLYYFKNKNSEYFLKMTFPSSKTRDYVNNKILSYINVDGIGNINIEKLEYDELYGNTIMRMLSDLEMELCQWFKIEIDGDMVYDANMKISKLENEYIVEDYNLIKPIDKKESINLTTNPGILVMDIETRTENYNKVPVPSIDTNYVYMISCIYCKFGIPNSLKKYLIVLGDCDDIPDTILIKVKDEIELIRAYEMVVKETDPVIISGYNIYNYDFWYLDHRLKRCLKNWSNTMSLLNEEYEKELKFYNKEWKSSAYRTNKVNYPVIQGRVYIDMMIIIQRGHKLPKYSLDFVSKYFIGDKKNDMSAKEMFRIYDLPLGEERNKEMALVGEYCVQDSVLVYKLFEKFNIWYQLIEESNINNVNMSFLTTRGQQIRVLNLIIREKNYRMKKDDVIIINKIQNIDMFFAGASVYEPILGKHENVMTVDFGSLYPSIIRGYNMCFTTLIKPEYNDQVDDSLVNICEWKDEVTFKKLEKRNYSLEKIINGSKSQVNEDNIVFEHKFKYLKKDNYLGILPKILGGLLMERKAVRVGENTRTDVIYIYDFLNPKERGITDDSCEEYFFKIVLLYYYLCLEKPEFIMTKMVKDEFEFVKDNYEIVKDNFEIVKGSCSLLKDEIIKYYKMYDPKNSFEYEKLYKYIINKCCEEFEKTDFYLRSRKNFSNSAEFIKNVTILKNILKSRQLALKATANSIYGFTGTKERGMLPCTEISISITAIGRTLIKKVENWFKDKYPESRLIYGDTDSAMVQFKNLDTKNVKKFGQRIGDEITEFLNIPTLKMEYEKTFAVFIAFTKKNYAGVLYDDYGNVDLNINRLYIKGLPPVRRDFSKWIRDFFLESLILSFQNKPIKDAFNLIEDKVYGLFRREYTAEDLTVTTNINQEYKSKTYPIALFKKYYEERGDPVKTDDRVEFILIKNDERYKGDKMRKLDDYKALKKDLEKAYENGKYINYSIALNKFKSHTLDYDYYINNVLTKQCVRILSKAFSDQVGKYTLEELRTEPRRRNLNYTSYCPEYGESLLRLINIKREYQKELLSYFKPKQRLVLKKERQE